MTVNEFENTEWQSGMLANINGNVLEIISINLCSRWICVLYNDESIWLPCCFVELVNN